MAEGFVPFSHFATDAIHEGQEPEQWSSRALIPLISLSTTFKQEEPGKVKVSLVFCYFFIVTGLRFSIQAVSCIVVGLCKRRKIVEKCCVSSLGI